MIWRDQQGTCRCFYDACPHRLVSCIAAAESAMVWLWLCITGPLQAALYHCKLAWLACMGVQQMEGPLAASTLALLHHAQTVQVPLSDGRITPEGKLECPYVRWGWAKRQLLTNWAFGWVAVHSSRACMARCCQHRLCGCGKRSLSSFTDHRAAANV